MQLATKENKAVALVTVLIFVLISAIIAGALVALVSSEARLIESQIRRIKAIYAAEAGIQQAIWQLRNNQTITNPNINNLPLTITSNHGPGNTTALSAQVDYTTTW